MYTILITGGTGFIGEILSKYLAKNGYHVIILTRNRSLKNNAEMNIEYSHWDIEKKEINISHFQKADYILHLAGAGIFDKYWTKKYKNEIISSRIKSSEFIIECLQKYPNNVKAVVGASAIGWYCEDQKDSQPFKESDIPDKCFLGETCRLWEESISPIETMNIRLVKLRIGIVLSKEGGALSQFKKPLKFGIAAIFGKGHQILSWIHMDDLCRLFITTIENENINGIFNAVAPNPVSNKDLTIILAKSLRKEFFITISIPFFILKIIFGERIIEILKSKTVSCKKIRQYGFTFLYPTIESIF